MRGTRRKARADALQILYQLDMNHTLTPQAGLEHFDRSFSPDTSADGFVRRLVLGVTENLAALDGRLAALSTHWKPARMPAVDRNILRLGVYELEHCDDIPATVSINEMIELAKAFGSENSPAFVNGVLDKVKSGLDCPNKAK